MTEDQLQAQFWTWCWNTPGHEPYRRHLWAVTNSGLSNPVRAKAMGLLSGVWDLHAYWNGQLHIIETKVGNNDLTTDRVVNGKKVYGQQEWGEIMANHGAIRHIYRTMEEGQAIFRSIFGNLNPMG